MILAGYIFFCIRCFVWLRTKVLQLSKIVVIWSTSAKSIGSALQLLPGPHQDTDMFGVLALGAAFHCSLLPWILLCFYTSLFKHFTFSALLFSGADSLFWNFQTNNWASCHCPWKHSSPVWVWHCRSMAPASVPSADIMPVHRYSGALMFSCWPPRLQAVLTHPLKLFFCADVSSQGLQTKHSMCSTACISELPTRPVSGWEGWLCCATLTCSLHFRLPEERGSLPNSSALWTTFP